MEEVKKSRKKSVPLSEPFSEGKPEESATEPRKKAKSTTARSVDKASRKEASGKGDERASAKKESPKVSKPEKVKVKRQEAKEPEIEEREREVLETDLKTKEPETQKKKLGDESELAKVDTREIVSAPVPTGGRLVSRLYLRYKNEVRPAMMRERGLNFMEVPRITKVVVNIGVGEAKDNPKALEGAIKTLTVITGQKPVVTRAKKSISNFKLREGQANGAYVTLRGQRMWHFLDKLMNLTLPRVRDFQGVSVRGFDGQGNYNLGFRDQLIFPEIIFDEIEHMKGLQVVVVTTAKDDALSADLLVRLGMPFRDYKVAVEVA